MLKRQKLPKKFSLNQPGQTYEEDYINPQDIKVLNKFNKINLIKNSMEKN